MKNKTYSECLFQKEDVKKRDHWHHLNCFFFSPDWSYWDVIQLWIENNLKKIEGKQIDIYSKYGKVLYNEIWREQRDFGIVAPDFLESLLFFDASGYMCIQTCWRTIMSQNNNNNNNVRHLYTTVFTRREHFLIFATIPTYKFTFINLHYIWTMYTKNKYIFQLS